MDDAIGQMARSLKNIERHLAMNGGMGGGGGGGSGSAGGSATGILTPGKYIVAESADMDYANADGTVTVEPGEEAPLVTHEFINDGGVLLAVGATDEQDVRYRLEVDQNRTVGGQTESPLGVMNNEFSFVEKLGGAVPGAKSFTYFAQLDGEATAPVDLAARIHVEES